MSPDLTPHVRVFKDANALCQGAAEFIIRLAEKAVEDRKRFVIALSGGSTPENLYKLLATHPYRERMPWSRIFIFWGDERCVPPDSPENNAGRAKSLLIDQVQVSPDHVFRIPTGNEPEEAAAEYEKTLKAFFARGPLRFDLVLLGVGTNGHTASIFPGTPVVKETEEGVRAVFLQDEKKYRITFTAPLINQARHVLFLATGTAKTEVMKAVMYGRFQPDILPAQLIRPDKGTLHWFIDQEAAGETA